MPDKEFPLHECIFNGDIQLFSTLLRTQDVSRQDKHGNTPLHLAAMLGKHDFVQLLVSHGAAVKVKNLAGWSPLGEAISYGDRETILCLLRKWKEQVRESLEDRRPRLTEALNKIRDFYMELKWDFQSWLPIVSRYLPSDLCKIYKRGTAIRVDSTLVDFNGSRWERGDITFLFNGSLPASDSLVIMDNIKKVFQKVRHLETEDELQDEVDGLMTTDQVCVQMSTKSISFARAQTGWIFRQDKSDTIGSFVADYYVVGGLIMEARKRREHLSVEDIRMNKMALETLRSGNIAHLNGDGDRIRARKSSLPPPPPSTVTWEEYVNCEPGNHPTLGRPLVEKATSKAYKATVAMSNDFPLSVEMLLNVLEILAPYKRYNKLREFIELKLPPGFPVKLDIPVMPTVAAKVTFHDFKFCENSESLFNIPEGYKEDPTRFPDL